jgi:hypothetical protein
MNNKDLISQYVDTGLKIDRYQIDKLSSSDKRTYLRKRVMNAERTKNLPIYEINLLDDATKLDYLESLSFDSLDIVFGFSRVQADKDALVEFMITNNFNANRAYKVLLKHYNDLDKLIGIILERSINTIDTAIITDMVINSSKPEYIISMVLNNEHCVSVIKPKTMDYILIESSNPKQLIQLFLKLRKGLSEDEAHRFLEQGLDRDYNHDFLTIEIYKYFKDTVTDEQLRHSIIHGDDSGAMIKTLNNIFGEERINKII